MKALVTGGTGFIGSNLVLKLLEYNYEIFATGGDREQKFNEKVNYLGQNFSNLDLKKLGKLDFLFHQAAINETTLLDKELMFKINVEEPKILFKDAVNNGCNNIVYASSTAVYGDVTPPYVENMPVNPLNPYGESKKLLDDFAMEFAEEHKNVIIVGLRYCNVYGPGEAHKKKRSSMIYQLAQQMIKSNPKIFRCGEQKRDFIYIKDVVRANLLAARSKESCVVNCGYGKATSFNNIILILNEVLGMNKKPEYIDNPYESMYQNHTECSMSLAKEKLGFVPQFDIRAGIKDYYNSGFLANNS
ncbi:NAD-dependent epimerase/dehydratase family protein [Candidatus Woesearchaeota archaeon]|nr:NAD-dependent epimerase/dehydratase family protein [Candidatus Woesearchaeota archaeon]